LATSADTVRGGSTERMTGVVETRRAVMED
jgi:hypothetical protein